LRDLRGLTVPRREIKFQFAPPPPPPPVGFKVDTKAFNAGRVDQTVELDGVEQWTIRSETEKVFGWHPLHIHVNDFQVQAIKLAAPDPVLDPLLETLFDPVFFSDTVPLPPLGHVEIRAEFPDFTGKFVYHCHFLDHEDNGMMGVIDVAQPVRIVDGALMPETVTVHAGPSVSAVVNSGTTVVWTNLDDQAHTITADAVDFFTGTSIFDSGNLDPGQSFAHTFDAPGATTYHCTRENPAAVTGSVVVTAEQTVDIRDFAFQPDPVMIAAGTTVTWTNRDADPHTATADAVDAASEPVFDTGQLAQGDAGSHTFATIGDFPYHCTNHLGMTGTIAVRPVTRQSVSIGIFDEGLQQTALEVFADSTVTWTNRGKKPVSVVVSGAEASGVLDPEQIFELGKALLLGQRFSHTFGTAGDVSYQVEAATEPVTTFEGTVKVIQPVAIVGFSKFAFEPAEIAIPAGAEVVWFNRDSTAHTATAKDLDPGTGKPVFDTGTIEPGAFHRLKIDAAGTFAYRCTAHPEDAESEGTITVMAPTS
jgi:plastocyanin